MNIDFDRLLSSLRDILKIESVKGEPLPGRPFGQTVDDAMHLALKTAKRLGFTTVNMEGMCGYAEIGRGELFGILGHVDVVPAGNDWIYDPFGAEVHDEVLYGRGVLDDKGPMIACLYAIRALLDAGLLPKKRIRLIFGCDEESGWNCMNYYTEHAEMPALGFSPDADFPVISCEKGLVHLEITLPKPAGLIGFEGGTRTNMVPDRAVAKLAFDPAISERAVKDGMELSHEQTLKVTATGVSAHGSTPQSGKNAIVALLSVLGESLPEARRLSEAFSDPYGEGLGIAASDEKSGCLTQNLGTARTEEDKLILTLDVRYPLCVDKKELVKTLKTVLNTESVRIVHEHPSLYVDSLHPLVTTLLDSYKKVTGDKAAKPLVIGGATYARAMKLGVAFGPLFPDEVSTIHQANECVTFENLRKMTEIYAEAILKLCF